jgi:hypothetical protein
VRRARTRTAFHPFCLKDYGARSATRIRDEQPLRRRNRHCTSDLFGVRETKVAAKAFWTEGEDEQQDHDDAALKESERQRVSEVIAE